MAVKKRKTKAVREFGDFQTPPTLALSATQLLCRLGFRPRSIVEPTCGRGAFVVAAVTCFPDAESITGVEVNEDYLHAAAEAADQTGRNVDLRQGDFFEVDWAKVVTKAGAPWLILGNPPWVTSAELGAIESENLPEKSNFHGRAGIEAVTGKSNFDISEWMLLRYLDWLDGSAGVIAVLCKTTVARKILLHIWRKKISLRSARIHKINALRDFGAAVDACFFVLEIEPQTHALSCDIFDAIDAESPSHTIGFRDGHIINDVSAFNLYRNLLGPEEHYVWRSGVKHDCSKVMELMRTPNGYRNGLGEIVDLENSITFPLLKSSDIGNRRVYCRGVMLVTQNLVGEETRYISINAPKTWAYLLRHAALFDKRGSVIYKNKPAFSVFGVGPYTFAPWKIAISGFYKQLAFVKVGPFNDRPVVFDDTVYFLPCWSEDEANFLEVLLLSDAAQGFFQSMIHWDEKRPITVEILKRLSIRKLSALLGREQEYLCFSKPEDLPLFKDRRVSLFDVAPKMAS